VSGGGDTRIFVDALALVDDGVCPPEFVDEGGDVDCALALDSGEHLLAEVVLEGGEVLLWEIDVVDAVDTLVAQLLVVFACRDAGAGLAPVVVLAADGLDGVVREVGPCRHQRVDVAVADQVRDDAAHPRGDHRAREAEEHGRVRFEHLGVDIDGLVDLGRADARRAVLLDEVADGHPRLDSNVVDRVMGELLAFGVVWVVAVGVVGHARVWAGRGFQRRGPVSGEDGALERSLTAGGLPNYP
jgi:hypothetical protein